MSDWGTGFATGIPVGLGLGVATGRKQNPWSELTEKEKKVRIAIVAALEVASSLGLLAMTVRPGDCFVAGAPRNDRASVRPKTTAA